jgi:hypothetical protein
MTARFTFLFIAAFWAAMNILLWRTEYGAHDGEFSVPADLVWKKILTAPDASSLTISQDGQRTGFCEFSTSIEQAMAALDESKPPPEGLIARAGYQIRLNGNVSLGDFTNRVRFDGRIGFFSNRTWRDLILKLSSHYAVVEVDSFATNQSVHLKITSNDSVVERNFTFADLQNPNVLLHAFAGDFADDEYLDDLNLPIVPQSSTSLIGKLHWEARRERMKFGNEPIFVYRLETQLLHNQIVVYVSTLGEILRVELPGGVTATLDEWNKP